MCVPIVCEPKHGVCEASRRKFLVHLYSAILAEGVRKLKCVELHVRVAVRQPLDHGGDYIFGACVGRADFVAHILEYSVSQVLIQGAMLPVLATTSGLPSHEAYVRELRPTTRTRGFVGEDLRTSMYSQFSLVRFSSVAFVTTSSKMFDCARNMLCA